MCNSNAYLRCGVRQNINRANLRKIVILEDFWMTVHKGPQHHRKELLLIKHRKVETHSCVDNAISGSPKQAFLGNHLLRRGTTPELGWGEVCACLIFVKDKETRDLIGSLHASVSSANTRNRRAIQYKILHSQRGIGTIIVPETKMTNNKDRLATVYAQRDTPDKRNIYVFLTQLTFAFDQACFIGFGRRFPLVDYDRGAALLQVGATSSLLWVETASLNWELTRPLLIWFQIRKGQYFTSTFHGICTKRLEEKKRAATLLFPVGSEGPCREIHPCVTRCLLLNALIAFSCKCNFRIGVWFQQSIPVALSVVSLFKFFPLHQRGSWQSWIKCKCTLRILVQLQQSDRSRQETWMVSVQFCTSLSQVHAFVPRNLPCIRCKVIWRIMTWDWSSLGQFRSYLNDLLPTYSPLSCRQLWWMEADVQLANEFAPVRFCEDIVAFLENLHKSTWRAWDIRAIIV